MEKNARSTLAKVNETTFSQIDRQPTPAEMLQQAANAAVENMLNTSIGYYTAERQPGDLDLVQYVRQQLINNGIAGVEHFYDTNRHVIDAKNKRPHAQSYHLNRFFSEQLMLVQAELGIDTRVSRYCLIYEVQPEQWMTIIDKQVLPALISSGFYHAG